MRIDAWTLLWFSIFFVFWVYTCRDTVSDRGTRSTKTMLATQAPRVVKAVLNASCAWDLLMVKLLTFIVTSTVSFNRHLPIHCNTGIHSSILKTRTFYNQASIGKHAESFPALLSSSSTLLSGPIHLSRYLPYQSCRHSGPSAFPQPEPRE